MKPTGSLRGKTVVVTGASSGLGRGTALALAAAGAQVVLAARRSDVIEQLAAQIDKGPGAALAVPTDVSDAGAVAALAAAAVDRFGGIDVWINNVGIGAVGLFWDVPVADHARVIDVNVNGLVYGAHAALGVFRRQGSGVLLNVGSVDGDVPLTYQSSYAASKAALSSLSRTIREELRLVGEHRAITVGTILPWAVDTPWWSHAANYSGHAPRMTAMDGPERVVEAIVAACVRPRLGQPVGWKARGAELSNRIAPALTLRLAALIARAVTRRGAPAAGTTGNIYAPVAAGAAVDGGNRERMRREGRARHSVGRR